MFSDAASDPFGDEQSAGDDDSDSAVGTTVPEPASEDALEFGWFMDGDEVRFE
jgi:hypothetical protein